MYIFKRCGLYKNFTTTSYKLSIFIESVVQSDIKYNKQWLIKYYTTHVILRNSWDILTCYKQL